MTDPIAEADQGLEQAKALAFLLAGYFKELTKRGFQRSEALELTGLYQGELFENSRGQDAG